MAASRGPYGPSLVTKSALSVLWIDIYRKQYMSSIFLSSNLSFSENHKFLPGKNRDRLIISESSPSSIPLPP